MTQTTQTVLSTYQVRKTKKQKADFRAYLRGFAEGEGYAFSEEKGSMGAVNAVVGDPTKARVVYTAHYDTCARLPVPNFITPKCIWLYLLYQVGICLLLMFLPAILLAGLVGFACGEAQMPELVKLVLTELTFTGVLVLMMVLIIVGPANKHTVNDNTSGVLLLMELMQAMPKELRGEVAFVFFDLEEAGLFGSASFASKHRKSMSKKLLLNFDCVSDGEHIIFAVGKGARRFAPALEAAFPSTAEVQTEVLTRGVCYPSDQMNFPCGVGVASLKATKGGKLLYMDRIHTRKDTVYREENIAYLVSGSIALARDIASQRQEALVM